MLWFFYIHSLKWTWLVNLCQRKGTSINHVDSWGGRGSANLPFYYIKPYLLKVTTKGSEIPKFLTTWFMDDPQYLHRQRIRISIMHILLTKSFTKNTPHACIMYMQALYYSGTLGFWLTFHKNKWVMLMWIFGYCFFKISMESSILHPNQIAVSLKKQGS